MDGDNTLDEEQIKLIFEHPAKTHTFALLRRVLGKARIWSAWLACFWYQEMINNPQNNLKGVYDFFIKFISFFMN